MSTLPPPPAYPGRGPAAYRSPVAPTQPYAQPSQAQGAPWPTTSAPIVSTQRPVPQSQPSYHQYQPQYQPPSAQPSHQPQQHYISPRGPPQAPQPQSQPATIQPQSPWVEQLDTRTGKMYYYNPSTRQTQWERPPGFGTAAPPPPVARVPAIPPTAHHQPAAHHQPSAPSPAAYGHLQMQPQQYPGHNPQGQQTLYPSMNPQPQSTAYPNLVPMGLPQPVASAPTAAAISGNPISAIPMSYVPSNAPKAGRVAITSPQQLVDQLCKMGFTNEEATQAAAVESTVDQAAEWILAYRVSKMGGFDDTSSSGGGFGGGGGDGFEADDSDELASLIERLTTFYALVPKSGALTGLDDDKIAHIAKYYKGREDKLNKRLQEKYGFDLNNMDFADTSSFEPTENQGPPLPALSAITVFVRAASLNDKGKHVYTLAVLGPDNEPREVEKRYSEFDALRLAVRADCKDCAAKLDALPFPKKTMSMSGAVSAAVAEKRREELENWLQGVCALEALCAVAIPNNYHPAMILPPQPGVPTGAARAVSRIHTFIGLLQPTDATAPSSSELSTSGEEAGAAPAPADGSWGAWLSGGGKKAATTAGAAGATAASATASAAALVPVQCKLSAQTLAVEATAGPLGLVLEERDGPANEVCPRVFLSELKPVDGRANKLQGLVPEGSSLLSIDGHDVTTCSLQRTTDFFVQATNRSRQLGFQVVHFQPLGTSSPYQTVQACNGGNVGGGSITKCLEFSVVAPSGELGLVFNERKDVDSVGPGLPKVFVSALTNAGGRQNPLTAKIPVGAALVSVCGEDVMTAGLSEVGEVLSSMRHCERELVMRIYV